jgi:hypothetical protein
MNTNEKLVRLYDFDTEEITTIPAAELAPGMVEASIEGLEGTYWINPNNVGNLKQTPFQHGPFDQETRERIIGIMNKLKEVRSLTFKEWEDGFRRDLHADQEIIKWVILSGRYEELAKRHSLIGVQRQLLFRVLLTCSMTAYDKVWHVLDHGDLPVEIARDVVEVFYGHPALKKQFSELDPGDYADENGDEPILVTLIENPELRGHLLKADIIFGMDCFTHERSLFFGLERLKKIVASGNAEELQDISILYDSRTDQLEYLCGFVATVKGSHCYGQK